GRAEPGTNRAPRGKNPAVAIGGTLHRRAPALALGKLEIVADADFVAVLQHRRAGKREQQAVGELDASSMVVDHGSKTAADATVVQLHLSGRSKRLEYLLALCLREASEIELVVAAEEMHPLRGVR